MPDGAALGQAALACRRRDSRPRRLTIDLAAPMPNPVPMQTAPYSAVMSTWPESGQLILAQFDANHIVVYQAYRPAIAEYATRHQHFGGEFSFNRMSWVKPNFLWMMFRSGWASKPGQERILAVTIPRSLFDHWLQQAVASSFAASGMRNEPDWRDAIASSDVRLQWDPDHDPYGHPLQRRAVQLGLRGQALREYAAEQVVRIEDITGFVVAQREHVQANRLDLLEVPIERVYRSEPIATSEARIDQDGR